MEIAYYDLVSIDYSVKEIKKDVAIILTGYSEKKKADAVRNLYDNLYHIQNVTEVLGKKTSEKIGGEEE